MIAASVTMAAGVAPFVVTLAVLEYWVSPPPYAVGLLTVATFVAAGLAPWYTHGSLALLGNYALRQRLGRRAGTDLQAPVEELGAVFVGFSPGEELRIWDGETDRDVGFLSILADTLTYAGDEFKWSLPRAQIDNVALGVPVAGIRRIIVRWHVPRGGPRAFSIVCREANTLQALSVVNARLYRALRDWLWRDRPSPSGIPLKWGYPPTDTSGGWTLDRPISGGCISVMAIALIVVLSIWRVSGALLAVEDYYTAVLWAGLIAVVGAVFTGYLLNYLHYWEARKHNR